MRDLGRGRKHGEVGRVERGEGCSPLGVVPTHAVAELANGIDGKLHELERGAKARVRGSDVVRHQVAGNVLHGLNAKASKVGRANLREEALHEQSDRVKVRNSQEGVGRATVALEVANGHPEQPIPKRAQALELLGDRDRGTDLARALEEIR